MTRGQYLRALWLRGTSSRLVCCIVPSDCCTRLPLLICCTHVRICNTNRISDKYRVRTGQAVDALMGMHLDYAGALATLILFYLELL